MHVYKTGPVTYITYVAVHVVRIVFWACTSMKVATIIPLSPLPITQVGR